MQAEKIIVSLAIQDVTDIVTSIGNETFQQPVTCQELVDEVDGFSFQKDMNGNIHLVTTKVFEAPKLIGAFKHGEDAYERDGIALELIEPIGLVGGRPIRRPHAY